MGVIVLIGFMGAGKTTVGRQLAEALDVDFIDSDVHIEARQGRPIREIFAAEGEPVFRQLEHQAIAELIDGTDLVLAVGGGAAEHERTRQAFARATVVYLYVSYTEALSRVGGDRGRPMLQRNDLTDVYRRRQETYAELADLTVDTSGISPEQTVQAILRAIKDR